MHIPMEEQVEQGVSPMLSVCGVTTPNVAHGRAALCQMLAAMGSPSMQRVRAVLAPDIYIRLSVPLAGWPGWLAELASRLTGRPAGRLAG